MLRKAVIFDLDGVLLDSVPSHFDAWREFLGRFGIRYTREDFDRDTGPSTAELMARHIHSHGLPISLEAAVEEKDRLAETRLRSGPLLFPGVRETLGQLRPSRRMAVATSAGRAFAESVLGHAGLADDFDAVVTGDDVQRTKPDPALFLTAARRLDTPPAHCVVVEDSPLGIEAARAAGMACIALSTSFPRPRLSLADAVVPSITDVPAVLERWKA